ncbi:Nif3-like dinuclear metal center hexameric protein [Thiovibrio frasassiensis]|uniref:GTP cyclohydrolase 1 type 2 homolog n=1 Tax=Thiovibrio frasassiensis TaxID=2984131 RepID=A0A9X4RKJ7_9BACT|nr:Nif3-like dinuclear metal center hexameric protein [Thiovibrio frasassiensis]MDG4475101.1 Nif3-like dinuclear metal center hexameric protein [Thiovibrio frasassiensis]
MPEELFSTTTFLSILNSIAPFAMAEPWDNVGLMVGDPDQQVSGILIGLDPTEALLHEALSLNLNTILTHHPLIFHPLKTIPTNTPMGRVLKTALANDLSLIACHTNLDLIAAGVSNALAERLGLRETRPLTGQDPAASGAGPGFGKIGTLPAPLSPEQFFRHLLSALDTPGIQLAGSLPETIHTVALCGGSGSELAETARSLGAQVYITGEVKHSVARWAEEAGFCVIDAGHYPTEHRIVPVLAEILTQSCAKRGFTPTITPTTQQHNPMQWVVFEDNKPRFCQPIEPLRKHN